MSEEAAKLASYGRRSFNRGDWSWRITDIRAVGNSLRIEAEASNGDETLIWRKDQPSPFEWMEVVNPRTQVMGEDGPEEDYIEALKIELDRFLERRVNA